MLRQSKLEIFKKTFVSLLLVFILAFSVLPLGNIGKVLTARADEITSVESSNVLDDLKKDENFNEDDYKINRADFSVKVIQIAIGSNKELFVYVYTPADFMNFEASSINISTSIEEALEPKNYKLQFLNRSGVFSKYRVLNLESTGQGVEYFEVVSIFRPWDERIDKKAEGDNVINEVAFHVGQQWTILNSDGEINYFMLETETIEVTDKFVGFIRYRDGFHLFYDKACDVHFVAFDTDKPIDQLIETDVYYESQRRQIATNVNSLFTIQPKYFEVVPDNYVTLSSERTVDYETGGWFKYKYSWKEIESVDEFISRMDQREVYEHGLVNVADEIRLTDDGRAHIESKKWVLNFAITDLTETPKKASPPPPLSTAPIPYTEVDCTVVSNVSILRLYFMTDGEYYNLGVVDNKQTGSEDPVGETSRKPEMPDWLKWTLIILAVIVIVTLLIVFEPAGKFVLKVLKGLGIAFYWLMVGVWYVVASPFYLIRYLVKISKKRKKGGKTKNGKKSG